MNKFCYHWDNKYSFIWSILNNEKRMNPKYSKSKKNKSKEIKI